MIIITIILFLTAALAILLGGHYFLYFTAVRIIGIADTRHKIILAAGLFALAISFIALSILARSSHTLPAKIAYYASSWWLGLANYLLLAFALGWLIVMILKYLRIETDPRIIFAILSGLAVITTIYGTWNAANPIIKNIEVRIENLPEYWEDKTIALISDVHLGIVNDDRFMLKIVDKINGQNPSALLIAGDYYDGTGTTDFDRLASPLKSIKAPLGTFFIPGNHETYIREDRALEALETAGVNVLTDNIKEINGLSIIGIDYPRGREARPSADKILETFDFNRPHIIMYHSPDAAPKIKNSGAGLFIAGHTHGGQIFPINFITKLIYGRYASGLSAEDDFTAYTSIGAGTWGPPLRVGNRPEIVILTLRAK